MKTGAYCGAVALASFLAGVLAGSNPVPAMYFGLALTFAAGIGGFAFEDRS